MAMTPLAGIDLRRGRPACHPAKGAVMARTSDGARGETHPAQYLALAIGIVYTLVGLLGFLVTGFDNFASETNKTLLGFEINPLHNIVHLLIGAAGIAMWRPLRTARLYGWILAAGYGLTFLFGLFAAGNSDINFLSLNGADNGLHLVSALAGLAVALWPARRTATASGR
jgi:4-amino-4-deoxy-L-arabinose transferase-like glycosyltransferase